jgi:phosphonate transport system permease protein
VDSQRFSVTTVVARKLIGIAKATPITVLVRTIPNLLLAALFVAIFGIGEATGVLTIAVFTFGMISYS